MKKILFAILCILFWYWSVHAALSDGFFCLLKSEQVVISLEKTSWFYACNDVILSLESMLVEAAYDLQTIDQYLSRWRDVAYWTTIRNDKLIMIDKLHVTRKNIIQNISVFENNLVVQSVYYFIISITPYRLSLYHTLRSLTWESLATETYRSLLKKQIETIESLSRVQNISQLIPLLDSYIYFKKQLSWKFE